jgi:hypothetical protein
MNLNILAQLGGGHLACTHPPPVDVPETLKAGMIFAVNDIASPVWQEYVTPALDSGKLLYLSVTKVIRKGLDFIKEGLKMCKEGVSATNLCWSFESNANWCNVVEGYGCIVSLSKLALVRQRPHTLPERRRKLGKCRSSFRQKMSGIARLEVCHRPCVQSMSAMNILKTIREFIDRHRKQPSS